MSVFPNKRRAVESSSSPSEWALRELPARAATFLHAAGTYAPLRAALERGGYTAAEHAEGLRLLCEACRYRSGGLDPAEDDVARQALAEIFTWARTHLPRLRAALSRLHPDSVQWLPPPPNDDAQALLCVATLLEHLRSLETTDSGREVLQTLTARGFDQELRTWLANHVSRAQNTSAPQGAPLQAPRLNPKQDPTSETPPEIIALHDWLDDWSATAKALVKRKDWLGRLGVVRRR